MDAAKDWCERHGFILSTEHFKDEGRSAFKGKHLEGEGELKRFIRLVESGKIKFGSVLILESFDRLSRLPITKAVSLFLNLLTSGVGMVFTMTHDKRLITQSVVDAEPYILYAIVGEAQRAHSESKHKSERVADACRKRKERAKLNGDKLLSWCPPWCIFDKEKGYVVDEIRANIVRRIYKEYLNGYGPYRIARMFNLQKVPTMGHRGRAFYKNSTRQWYKKGLRDFLMDKRVYGYAHHLNRENYYPTIIPKSTYHRLRCLLCREREWNQRGTKSGDTKNTCSKDDGSTKPSAPLRLLCLRRATPRSSCLSLGDRYPSNPRVDFVSRRVVMSRLHWIMLKVAGV